MRAWHFVGDRLRDGRRVPKDGAKLVHPGVPVLCSSGLHASLRPWHALEYAPGGTLCLVECGGTVRHQNDKLVCTERTILARMDAAPLLREFARMQALSVVHLWEPPDIVLDYLMGDDAAWAAAWAADYLMGDEAARAAAGAAAGAAVGAAVRAAVRAAAGAAARAAAWAAARETFDHMVFDSFEDWL